MAVVLIAKRGGGARRPAGPAGCGFSLIEVLVATAILFIVAARTVPLFTRAMISNQQGSDLNRVANFAGDRAEEFKQYPFGSEPLTVAPSTTKQVYNEYFSQEDDRWLPGTEATAPSGKTPLWSRTTTIRYYNVNDLETPLDNGAPPGSIQIKEIVVAVEGIREAGSPLGPSKKIAVRLYKAE